MIFLMPATRRDSQNQLDATTATRQHQAMIEIDSMTLQQDADGRLWLTHPKLRGRLEIPTNRLARWLLSIIRGSVQS